MAKKDSQEREQAMSVTKGASIYFFIQAFDI